MDIKYRVRLSDGRYLLAVNQRGAICTIPHHDAPYLDQDKINEYVRRATIKTYTLEADTIAE